MRTSTYGFIVAAGLALGGCSASQMNMNQAMAALSQGMQAASITDSDMASIASRTVQAMDAQNKVAPASSPYTQRLNRLTAGLTQADGIPLNFKVYITNDVNAFACPDGSVRVYSGIMDLMDDDELLGVIGHEIGHVAKHHSRKAFKKQLMNSAILEGIGATSDVAAALTQSSLARLGTSFSNASYSQQQENEADDCGYDFLKANGRNPWGMVEAFRKLQKLEAASGVQQSDISRMFSDHPDTRKRIANMEKRCIKDGIPRNGNIQSRSGAKPSQSAAESNYDKVRNTSKTINFGSSSKRR